MTYRLQMITVKPGLERIHQFLHAALSNMSRAELKAQRLANKARQEALTQRVDLKAQVMARNNKIQQLTRELMATRRHLAEKRSQVEILHLDMHAMLKEIYH